MDNHFIQFGLKNRKIGKPIAPLPKKNNNKKIVIIAMLCILFSSSLLIWQKKSKPEEKSTEIVAGEKTAQEEIPQVPEENVVSYTISEGDIPAEVFFAYGNLDANDTEGLLLADDKICDFSQLKIGHALDFVFEEEEKAKKIRYYPNSEQVIVAQREGIIFLVTEENIPYEKVENKLQVKIDEFLYKDALDAGLSEASVLEVADIFSFDVDFTTDIREGDELFIVYEKRTLNGKEAPDGKVLAAKFVNDGQEYFAYHFESEGEASHYDTEGKELNRQFLRAPLSYRKITSGYTGARLHPITKKVTAHYQIDYAAPIGTPVVATARGTVTSAGYEGGWGNMIRLRHDNGYTTHYGHLNAFAKGVRSGASVSQGQTIGYVGSTGWSTGPHLDYGMKLNGSPINPLSIKLPKGTPLEGEEMKKFEEMKKKYEEKLK